MSDRSGHQQSHQRQPRRMALNTLNLASPGRQCQGQGVAVKRPRLQTDPAVATAKENLAADAVVVRSPDSSSFQPPHYKMDHGHGRLAVIFNHYAFQDNRNEPRRGTEKDVEALCSALPKLGFKINKYQDLTKAQIIRRVNEVARRDHAKIDALMVIVMTHGNAHDIVEAHDDSYNARKVLIEPFLRNQSLAGKPKIFIIQACKGTNSMESLFSLETDGHTESISFPLEADCLFAYATVEGYAAGRYPDTGAIYIQALCEELRAHGLTWDLDTILTMCHAKVAEELLVVDGVPYRRQIPSFLSTLRKKVLFSEIKDPLPSVILKKDLRDCLTERSKKDCLADIQSNGVLQLKMDCKESPTLCLQVLQAAKSDLQALHIIRPGAAHLEMVFALPGLLRLKIVGGPRSESQLSLPALAGDASSTLEWLETDSLPSDITEHLVTQHCRSLEELWTNEGTPTTSSWRGNFKRQAELFEKCVNLKKLVLRRHGSKHHSYTSDTSASCQKQVELLRASLPEGCEVLCSICDKIFPSVCAFEKDSAL